MRSAQAVPPARKWPRAGRASAEGWAPSSRRGRLGEELAEPEPRLSSTPLMSSLGVKGKASEASRRPDEHQSKHHLQGSSRNEYDQHGPDYRPDRARAHRHDDS